MPGHDDDCPARYGLGRCDCDDDPPAVVGADQDDDWENDDDDWYDHVDR